MRDVRLILEWVGRTLLVAGIVILGFVGYQLWGTGFIESRAQGNLRDQFDARAKAATTTTTAKPGSTAPTTTAPPAAPAEGAIAVIKIPRIGLERTVVQGVSDSDLREGPGHYPQTVMPGEIGNAAIAGHRTTYGAPFNQIDELKIGDPIIMRTLNGTYTYRVSAEPFDVTPRSTEVLDPSTETMLTLTTCTPKYSAARRLVVRAKLDTTVSPVPRPPASAQPKPATATESLSGAGVPVFGLLFSLFLCALIGAGWWYAFHRRPVWTTWVLGFVVFLPVLFLAYYFVERSLPATF